MTLADTCMFCALLAEGPLLQYDDGEVVVFTPLNPVTEGHMLVVPREHVRDAAADPDVTAAVMRVAADLVGWQPEDVNIITSVGAAATQTIFHLHVHVVPRREGDGLHLPWTEQVAAEAVLQARIDGLLADRDRLRALLEDVRMNPGLVPSFPELRAEFERVRSRVLDECTRGVS